MLGGGQGQSTSSMLLTCVVLFPLAISQVAMMNADQNIIGLRRVIYKVHNSDNEANDCRTFGCASQSNLQVDKSSHNPGFEEVKNHIEKHDDKYDIEEGNIKPELS